MKKIAIMQPYILPYIGYYQLVKYVDEFIIYDNIQYTKKGWINRNRFLANDKDKYFTVSLKKDSDYLNICDRKIALDYEGKVILNQLKAAYIKAPYFEQTFILCEKIFKAMETNLFDFIYNSLLEVFSYLEIYTKVIISSDININHSLKGSDKVIEICKNREADTYINPIGGKQLYDKETFFKNGINLKFIKTDEIRYEQLHNIFIPNLSIIDLLMFNSREQVKRMLDNFTLQ